MSRESFLSQGKQTEDQYFLEREKHLIEQLQKKAAAEVAKKELAEAVGVSDEAILDTLRDLGYDRDIVTVLHLFPLVAVAWADGEISEQERDRILEAARAMGIEPETPAHKKLLEWLATKPTEIQTERKLRIIRDLLQFRTADKQQEYQSKVADLCVQVAEASGGFLGLGRKTSAVEKAMLERITDELSTSHPGAAAKLVDKK
jgi:tellurite resistance protein